MLREEFRLHATLFGRSRFLVFPICVAGLVGLGVGLVLATGTDPGQVVAGGHLLALFFGLQVGTIGLVGRDAMRDLLGDVTLLVFSARTLPLSWRRLLATFVAKDLAYYGVLFVAPMAVGFAPLVATGDLGLADLGLFWATTVATFGFGMAASLAATGLSSTGRVALVAGLVVVGASAVAGAIDPVALTPYAVYLDPTPATAAIGLGPAALLAVVAVLGFEPARGGPRRRVRRGAFDRLRRWTRADSPLVLRPVLEVHRSSGSVWKVAFSLGLCVALTALLLERVASASGIDPSPGVALGALLGLGAFTTYSWVWQFGDPGEYLRYPVGYDRVFRGHLGAYLLCSLPVGVAYLAIASAWYPPRSVLLGLVVFPGIAVYVFGVTAYVAGPSPNDLLFDTGRFLLFGVALAAVAVPVLVAGLTVAAAPVGARAAALGISCGAGAVGLVLTDRAGPRWEAVLRAGDHG